MKARIVFDSGETLLVEEDGQIVGTDRRIHGAIRFSKRGSKVDAFFLREITTNPEAIPWKFENGTQRTRLYDEQGEFLEGSYVVVPDRPG